MDFTTIILIVLVGLALFAIYYMIFNKNAVRRWCPTCGKKTPPCEACPDCPSCLLSSDMAQQILRQFSQGCVNRLVQVQRESEASKSDLESFMMSGGNRLAVVTNVAPGDMVNDIARNPDRITAVSMSSTLSNGTKKFLVMVLSGGLLNSINLSTDNFDAAFNSFAIFVRRIVGDEQQNLVFYIDEDIPCVGQGPQPLPEQPILNPLPRPVPLPEPVQPILNPLPRPVPLPEPVQPILNPLPRPVPLPEPVQPILNPLPVPVPKKESCCGRY